MKRGTKMDRRRAQAKKKARLKAKLMPGESLGSAQTQGLRRKPKKLPVPTVRNMSPLRRAAGEQIRVTILGDHFQSGVRVFFGQVEARVLEVTDHKIVCLVFDNEPGGVGVRVNNPDGQGVNAPDPFTFLKTVPQQMTPPPPPPPPPPRHETVSTSTMWRCPSPCSRRHRQNTPECPSCHCTREQALGEGF